MPSHVTAGARGLARRGALDAALAPLGVPRRWDGRDGAGAPGIGWAVRVPTFVVQEPFERRPASAGTGRTVALLAPSPEAVEEAHAAGLAAGGADEGAPGERPRYRGAYPRDPEGNEPYVVHRGDLAAGQ